MASTSSDMSSQESWGEFELFNLLPAEIRQEIWKESMWLWYYTPKLYTVDYLPTTEAGDHSNQHENGPVAFPVDRPVRMNMPAALSVNAESRAAAIRFAMHNLTTVDYAKQPSHHNLRSIFLQRSFFPEIDTLYFRFSYQNIWHRVPMEAELGKKIRHIAVDFVSLAKFGHINRFCIRGNGRQVMPHVQTVSVVLPTTVKEFYEDYKPPRKPVGDARLEPIAPHALELAKSVARGLEIDPETDPTWLEMSYNEAGVAVGRMTPGSVEEVFQVGGPFTGFEDSAKVEACTMTELVRAPWGETRYVAVRDDVGDHCLTNTLFRAQLRMNDGLIQHAMAKKA